MNGHELDEKVSVENIYELSRKIYTMKLQEDKTCPPREFF